MPVSNADHVTPPRSTDALVGATTAGGLTSAIDLSAYQGRWITVGCDDGAGVEAGFYIQFGKTGETSASADATDTSAGATLVAFYAHAKDFEIDSATIECRIVGTAAGYYRIVPSSPK